MSQSLIIVDQISYNVTNIQIKTARKYNAHRPKSQPRCEELLLTVVAPGEESAALINWYVNNEIKDFDLYVNVRDLFSKECDRTFKCKKTYCFSIEEVYDNVLQRRHLIQLGFMVGELTLQNNNTSNHTIKSF